MDLTIKADDSFRTRAKKMRQAVELKKQKEAQKIVPFSPDNGKTVFLYHSEEERDRKAPIVVERLKNTYKNIGSQPFK